MIYATNSSFRVVKYETFIKLIEALRPGYKPPTRKDISDKLLDRVHNKLEATC